MRLAGFPLTSTTTPTVGRLCARSYSPLSLLPLLLFVREGLVKKRGDVGEKRNKNCLP